MPKTDYNFHFEDSFMDENYQPDNNIKDDREWVYDIYKNMLGINVRKGDDVLTRWVDKINEGESRQKIFETLQKIAKQESSMKKASLDFQKEIQDIEKNKRIAIVCDGGRYETLLATTLLEGIKELYPDKKIYFITHPANFDVLKMNPFIHKKINFFEEALSPEVMEGTSKEEGLVEVCYILEKTSKHKNLHFKSKDLISKDLYESNI